MIGIAVGLIDSCPMVGVEIRLFALIGGFTTYSASGYETFVLLRDADYFWAVSNLTIHIVLGLFLVCAGYKLTSR